MDLSFLPCLFMTTRWHSFSSLTSKPVAICGTKKISPSQLPIHLITFSVTAIQMAAISRVCWVAKEALVPADAMSGFLFLARIKNPGSLTHGPWRPQQTVRSGFSNLELFQIWAVTSLDRGIACKFESSKRLAVLIRRKKDIVMTYSTGY